MGHHLDDTNYPILRTTSKIDGTPIQEILDTIPVKPFGNQNQISQDGLAICIDDHLGLSNWGGYVSTQPRLNAFKFAGGDRPGYVPVNSHNTSRDDAMAIVNAEGAVGVKWSAVQEVI